jgi:hypothetical protein
MFRVVGLKFIDPNYEDSKDDEQKEQERIRKQTVKIKDKDTNKGTEKKGCC